MTPKEYLSRYAWLDMQINSKQEQADTLRARARSVSSPIIGTDTHSGNGRHSDPIGEITQKIVDLEQEINRDIDQLVDIQTEIRTVISRISDDVLRTLLEKKYLNCKSLELIAVEMSYSYRQICRLHGKALNAVKDVIECPTTPVL